MSIRAEDLGARVERFAEAELPLELLDAGGNDSPGGEWYDAELTHELADELGRVFDPGAKVEVKACCMTQRNGHSGRYWIRRKNHDRLLEAGGLYVFGLYSPSSGSPEVQEPGDVEINRLVAVSAAHVEDLITAVCSWTDPEGRDEHAKLGWAAVPGLVDGRTADEATISGEARHEL